MATTVGNRHLPVRAERIVGEAADGWRGDR